MITYWQILQIVLHILRSSSVKIHYVLLLFCKQKANMDESDLNYYEN